MRKSDIIPNQEQIQKEREGEKELLAASKELPGTARSARHSEASQREAQNGVDFSKSKPRPSKADRRCGLFLGARSKPLEK